jgi:hypothetical protein
MADTSYLFGSSPPPAYIAPSQSTSSLPSWLQDAWFGLTNQAASIANQPYNPFPGPQVAPLTDVQNQAISGASTVGQQPMNTLNNAVGTAQSGSTLFDPNQFQNFMNPYTSGLNDTIAQLGARNLSENLLPAVNDTFVGAGQFGSSRNADFTNRAVRDTNQDILNAQSQMLQNSYGNAMSNYQGALGRQVTAANTLGGIGNIQNQAGIQDIGAQLGAGGVQQGNQQQNLGAAIQNFQQQQNWPVRGLDIVNSILKGYSPGSTLQSYNTPAAFGSTYQASPGQSPIAGALNALGSTQALGQ